MKEKKKKKILQNKPALAAKGPGGGPDKSEKTISMDFCTLKMPLVSSLQRGSPPICLYYSSVPAQVARLLTVQGAVHAQKDQKLFLETCTPPATGGCRLAAEYYYQKRAWVA